MTEYYEENYDDIYIYRPKRYGPRLRCLYEESYNTLVCALRNSNMLLGLRLTEEDYTTYAEVLSEIDRALKLIGKEQCL